jgi:hypothetical protein
MLNKIKVAFIKICNFLLSLLPIQKFSAAFWPLSNFRNFSRVKWKRWQMIKKTISQLPIHNCKKSYSTGTIEENPIKKLPSTITHSFVGWTILMQWKKMFTVIKRYSLHKKRVHLHLKSLAGLAPVSTIRNFLLRHQWRLYSLVKYLWMRRNQQPDSVTRGQCYKTIPW